MPGIQGIVRASWAVRYWLGVGQRQTVERGDDLVFLCHGTPRSMAARLERQLRYLRTNVLVAYPMLRALGIPATFFVCPGLIEERRWLWTHEVRRRLEFAGRHTRRQLAAGLGAPAEVEAFVQWMKEMQFPRRARVETALRHATAGFVPSELEREAFDLARWDELRSLDPSIVTVGSHTMTHPVLPSLDSAQIEAELRDSRRLIEAKLARPADFFSYPNGDVDERTVSAVRRHYRAAVCCNSATRTDPHLIPTVHLPRGVLGLALKVNRPAVTSARMAPAR